jgi:arsenate reductase (glutaredoxin)
MMMITVYGIPNCDTVKKARSWLDSHGIAYVFHDFRRNGLEASTLAAWCAAVGWEPFLNRAGTTFRALADADKQGLDAQKAQRLMLGQPSMIKRPVVQYQGGLLVGFKPDVWATALK